MNRNTMDIDIGFLRNEFNDISNRMICNIPLKFIPRIVRDKAIFEDNGTITIELKTPRYYKVEGIDPEVLKYPQYIYKIYREAIYSVLNAEKRRLNKLISEAPNDYIRKEYKNLLYKVAHYNGAINNVGHKYVRGRVDMSNEVLKKLLPCDGYLIPELRDIIRRNNYDYNSILMELYSAKKQKHKAEDTNK